MMINIGSKATEEKKVILVIDDEKSIRETIAAMLEDADYEVLTACGGYERLDLLKKYQPDLVIVDEKMDDLNGDQVIKIARSDDYQYKGKIIFFTGLPFGEEIETYAKSIQADLGINKPIKNFGEFYRTIDELL